MNFTITLGDWPQQATGARAVRQQVFVIEQKIPLELEWDQMDAVSLHALACDSARQAIGTGRLLPDGHIGRMAVSMACRSHGIGAALLQTLMAEARQRGDQSVLLHAQTSVVGFYQRFGFVGCGDEFIEAGIPHLLMRHDFA
jgi:predicted GNAT family N-acyltransferase